MSFITSIAGFIGREARSFPAEKCSENEIFDRGYFLDLNHDGHLDIYSEYSVLDDCSPVHNSGKMLFSADSNTPLTMSDYPYPLANTGKARWRTTNSVPEIRWHKSKKDFGAKLGDVIQFGGTNVWLESVGWDDPKDPGSQQFTLRENFCGHASEPISVYVDTMPPMNGITIDLKQEVMDRFNCEHYLVSCKEADQELPIVDVEYLSYEIGKFNASHRNDLNALSNLAKQMKDCKKVDKGELLSTWSKIAPDLKDLILKSFDQSDQNTRVCKDTIWTWLEQAHGVDQNFINYIKASILEIDI